MKVRIEDTRFKVFDNVVVNGVYRTYFVGICSAWYVYWMYFSSLGMWKNNSTPIAKKMRKSLLINLQFNE